MDREQRTITEIKIAKLISNADMSDKLAILYMVILAECKVYIEESPYATHGLIGTIDRYTADVIKAIKE